MKQILLAFKRNFLFLATIVIFFLTFPLIGFSAQPGLDHSYIWALNYLFDQGAVVGKDIIFSYGPLGFLMFPQAIGNNLVIAIAVFSIIKIIFIYLALKLGEANEGTPIRVIILAVLVLILSSFVEFRYLFMYMLPFTVAMALLYYKETGSIRYLVIGTGVSAFATLTMMPSAVSSILILLSFILFEIIPHFRKRRKIIELIFIIVGFIYFFLIFWVVSNRTFSGIGTFILSRFEIASSNSSAMTISQNENWFLHLLFVVSFFGVPFLWRSKKVIFYYLLFIPTLYAIAKYGYSREDIHHVLYFWDFILIFFFLFLIYIGRVALKVLSLIILSLVILFANILVTFPAYPFDLSKIADRFLHLNGFINFYESVIKYNERFAFLQNISIVNLPQSVLSDQIKEGIKNKEVDTYPFELSYIPANNLSWKPRPVFQSYIVSTPWLDKRNEAFFTSPVAPEFVIFHYNWETYGKMESIDGRYILNDEPNTIMAIFNNYNVELIDSSVALLKKNNFLHFKKPVIIGRTLGLWNEWIKVKEVDQGVLRANVYAGYTPFGRLLRYIWKETEAYIDYRLQNREVTHRLVVDNMSSGVWVDPYIEKLSKNLEGEDVLEIRFRHNGPQPFENNIFIEWVFYPFY